MKTFDLARALAGDPVVDVNGNEANQFHLFNLNKRYNTLICVINSELHYFDENGRYDHNEYLFMAPKIKTYWINIFKNPYNIIYTDTRTYQSKHEAIEFNILHGLEYIKTISFEIEE